MQLLYKTYVLNSEVKQGHQDPKSIEEMGKHIFHLEKSIFQINKSTGKVITRRDKEIHKKTKENAELIYDLNVQKKNRLSFLFTADFGIRSEYLEISPLILLLKCVFNWKCLTLLT